jgi:hypothetical protein
MMRKSNNLLKSASLFFVISVAFQSFTLFPQYTESILTQSHEGHKIELIAPPGPTIYDGDEVRIISGQGNVKP